MKPFISVIIPNFNGEKFILQTLRSILQEKNIRYEVIVIENGSTDSSLGLLKRYYARHKRVKLFHLEKNRGSAYATNLGVAKSKGKYLFIINNDILIEDGWFNKILLFFQKYKKAGVGQAKILKMGTNKFDYAGDFMGPLGFLIERARGSIDRGQFNSTEKVFAVKGTAMFVRREVFKKLGGFDTNYHFMIEETDFAWRVWLSGYEVFYFPEITVWHAYGTKQKTTIKYYHVQNSVFYLGCRNTIMTLVKNLSWINLYTILPLNIICWILLSLAFFVRGEVIKSTAIIKGILWNILHIFLILRKRKKIQSTRKLTDKELFSMVGDTQNIGYYFGKGISYIKGVPF